MVRLEEIEHMIINSQDVMVGLVEESKRISAILKEEARLKLVAETKHKYCINQLQYKQTATLKRNNSWKGRYVPPLVKPGIETENFKETMEKGNPERAQSTQFRRKNLLKKVKKECLL